MQCTRFTDYSLRVLIYVARHPGEWITIRQIADAYGISRNHLMKVVSFLGSKGYLDSQRGPGGGVRLQVPAGEVRLADVILDAEGRMELIPPPGDLDAALAGPHARLAEALRRAMDAFLETLGGETLADLLGPRETAGRRG